VRSVARKLAANDALWCLGGIVFFYLSYVGNVGQPFGDASYIGRAALAKLIAFDHPIGQFLVADMERKLCQSLNRALGAHEQFFLVLHAIPIAIRYVARASPWGEAMAHTGCMVLVAGRRNCPSGLHRPNLMFYVFEDVVLAATTGWRRAD
jgi:hypothetical protein